MGRNHPREGDEQEAQPVTTIGGIPIYPRDPSFIGNPKNGRAADERAREIAKGFAVKAMLDEGIYSRATDAVAEKHRDAAGKNKGFLMIDESIYVIDHDVYVANTGREKGERRVHREPGFYGILHEVLSSPGNRSRLARLLGSVLSNNESRARALAAEFVKDAMKILDQQDTSSAPASVRGRTRSAFHTLMERGVRPREIDRSRDGGGGSSDRYEQE